MTDQWLTPATAHAKQASEHPHFNTVKANHAQCLAGLLMPPHTSKLCWHSLALRHAIAWPSRRDTLAQCNKPNRLHTKQRVLMAFLHMAWQHGHTCVGRVDVS